MIETIPKQKRPFHGLIEHIGCKAGAMALSFIQCSHSHKILFFLSYYIHCHVFQLVCQYDDIPFTPTSSTTKTVHHDIAEILLKVALSTKNKKQINT
jgi:hypothetical protein